MAPPDRSYTVKSIAVAVADLQQFAEHGISVGLKFQTVTIGWDLPDEIYLSKEECVALANVLPQVSSNTVPNEQKRLKQLLTTVHEQCAGTGRRPMYTEALSAIYANEELDEADMDPVEGLAAHEDIESRLRSRVDELITVYSDLLLQSYDEFMTDTSSASRANGVMQNITILWTLVNVPPRMLQAETCSRLSSVLQPCVKIEADVQEAFAPVIAKDPNVKAYFNCRSVDEARTVFRDIPVGNVQHALSKLPKSSPVVGGEERTTEHRIADILWNHAAQRPFQNNPFNTKTLLHFAHPFVRMIEFGPFELEDYFVYRASILADTLDKFSDLDTNIADRIFMAAHRAWPLLENPPFGYVYLLAELLGDDVQSASISGVESVLKRLADKRDAFQGLIQKGTVHSFFSDTGQVVRERYGSSLAEDHWTEMGLIYIRGLPPTILIPANMAIGWKQHWHHAYLELQESEHRDDAETYVGKTARQLVKQVPDGVFTPLHPIRTYKAKDIPESLESFVDVVNTLIIRRTVLRWARVCKISKQCGPESEIMLKFNARMGYGIRNLESVSDFFKRVGLKLTNLYHPDERGFFTEELDWLRTFAKR